jgi:hypothetical protein
MRKTLVILLLALLLLVPRAFKATVLEQNPDGADPSRADGTDPSRADGTDPSRADGAVPPERPGEMDGDDDIFSSAYEREMLSRRYFQKNLPPLSRREKIAWAFRTSRAGTLL